ncbi:hypothetical protein [Methylomagnum sp.]
MKPDEEFSRGPLHFARFGKDVIFQSNWSEGEFLRFQEKLVTDFPSVIEKINGLVEQIAEIVSELPPEPLLQRSWWDMAMKHILIEAEADVGTDEAVSVRMLDYIQSVIASVKPKDKQKDDVMEEDWLVLRKLVEDLFRTLNFEYQICRTANDRISKPDFNEEAEEFYFKAQLYWCNVRGKRYQAHERQYLSEIFNPHSDVFMELFDISANEFVEDIIKIIKAHSFGIEETIKELDKFRLDTLSALEKKLKSEGKEDGKSFADLMQDVIKDNGWQQRSDDVFGKFFGVALFDVQKSTNLPVKLLEKLSWSAGEESAFFSDGDFKGWPLRIWPIFKRPFIRLNNRFYCFHVSSLLDYMYRAMQRIIFELKPDYKETWKLIQQKASEDLPLYYLQKLLKNAKIVQSVYYPINGKDWCEADGLLTFDGNLFIVESRGGAFTYTSPATDFCAYIASLKNLVLKPATQGKRFIDYLNKSDEVPLYDSKHQVIDNLRKADFSNIYILAVTLDPFTEIAAQIQHLRKLGVNVGDYPIWSVSLDDLRIFADIFDNPLLFMHFAEQRMLAFQTEVLQLEDELDHLGLYLEHNAYSIYAQEKIGRSKSRINFHGYRSKIDKHFRARFFGLDKIPPLAQDTPPRILEIIEYLSRSTKEGRSKLSSYLLFGPV